MGEASRIKSTLAYFGQQICAQHLSAIDEIDGRGDMARVAVLGLDVGELRGELGREDQGEVFCGLVADGLLD